MQNLSDFSKKQRAGESAFTRGYFLGLMTDDRDDYKKYQAGCLEGVSEDKLLEMEVLSVLDRLSFPLQDVGTYLFKDMIVKAIQELDGYDAFGNVITEDELLHQMRQPFSQFYVDVARNELDMGIKTFHTHIERTLEDVDYKKADVSLLYEIYSNFSNETDYGEHAFIIAKHMRNTNKKKAPQFKKNFSDAAALKMNV